jgi:hypothetical protein
MFLLKLNSTGDTLWTKKYNDSGNNEAQAVIETSSGDLMIFGTQNSVMTLIRLVL